MLKEKKGGRKEIEVYDQSLFLDSGSSAQWFLTLKTWNGASGLFYKVQCKGSLQALERVPGYLQTSLYTPSLPESVWNIMGQYLKKGQKIVVVR